MARRIITKVDSRTDTRAIPADSARADDIQKGGGDDKLEGGTGDDRFADRDDKLEAGTGDDRFAGRDDKLEGGAGDDDDDDDDEKLAGNDGNDTLKGGAGDDLIAGGAGSDVLHGGTGNDTLIGGTGDDTLYGDDGNDRMDGGAGNDRLLGGAGDDKLAGGDGDDFLQGGAGRDLMAGGEGNDTFSVGGGDIAWGGGGDDVFTFDADALDAYALAIAGGDSGESHGDTLDLSGLGNIASMRVSEDPGGSKSGVIELAGGGVIKFTGIEHIICFVEGTRILTPGGEVAIEDLRVGDLVVTRDHGPQPLRWRARRRVVGQGRFAPIRFAPGALGNSRALLVSPQHRMLLSSARNSLYFTSRETLAAACHLTGAPGVARASCAFVTYHHLLFDRHEIIFAQGAPSESFHPGTGGIDALEARAREELFALFPALRSAPDGFGPAARPALKAHEAALAVMSA